MEESTRNNMLLIMSKVDKLKDTDPEDLYNLIVCVNDHLEQSE